MNAWVWHKKKEPPFYLGLRLLEMFIAISETIARPENNAKNSALQNVNYCVTDFVVPRYAFKSVPCNSRPAALPFCVIFWSCYSLNFFCDKIRRFSIMIKLIATDVDGTLVKDGTLLIDPEYMTVVSRLVDQGIYFVVCSGRQFSSEQKLFAPIKDRLLYISDGGTVVRTPEKILKTYPMETALWKSMCRMVHDELPSCDCFAATPDYCLAEDAGSRMFHWLRDSYGFDVREVPDLSKVENEDIIKFTIYHPTSCEELCSPNFIPAWKHQAKLAVAGKEWLDCNARGVSKWTGLSFLMNYFGLTPDEVCCFGDNLNDIEMLQNAGESYAVSNARAEVIASAKHTCPPYWENGVLQVLKTFLKETTNPF